MPFFTTCLTKALEVQNIVHQNKDIHFQSTESIFILGIWIL